MISVAEAIKTILEHIKILGTERVDVLSSLGRVLAEDITASVTIPPCDNSAMDGYAVRFRRYSAAQRKKTLRG